MYAYTYLYRYAVESRPMLAVVRIHSGRTGRTQVFSSDAHAGERRASWWHTHQLANRPQVLRYIISCTCVFTMWRLSHALSTRIAYILQKTAHSTISRCSVLAQRAPRSASGANLSERSRLSKQAAQAGSPPAAWGGQPGGREPRTRDRLGSGSPTRHGGAARRSSWPQPCCNGFD